MACEIPPRLSNGLPTQEEADETVQQILEDARRNPDSLESKMFRQILFSIQETRSPIEEASQLFATSFEKWKIEDSTIPREISIDSFVGLAQKEYESFQKDVENGRDVKDTADYWRYARAVITAARDISGIKAFI